MSYNFKTYNDLEIAKSLGDTSYILIEENGEVKRFAAAGVAAAASTKLDLYNIDNLSREEMITFAKELKEFLYLCSYDPCDNGDFIETTVRKNINYQLYYDDEDTYYDYGDGCDPCADPIISTRPASWALRADAFNLNLVEEEYNDILAAWRALCVNA